MDHETLLRRWRSASASFEHLLTDVTDRQWNRPTPCAAWDVRALTNHMTRGNLNYAGLLAGGSAADFLRRRDLDALGDVPLAAYRDSVAALTGAARTDGALDRDVDYPLGTVTGRRALAVRTIDSTIHAWDLARALDADDRLDPDLVRWAHEHWDDVYAEFVTPAAFAAPIPDGAEGLQDTLLRRAGRDPAQRLFG